MKHLALLALTLWSLNSVTSAEDWPHWRGPDFNGSSSEKNLPAKWEKSEALWSAELPGPSAATPVVQSGKVFVSTTDATAKSLFAVAFDAASGKEVWRHKTSERYQLDNRSNFASPSPVADAQRVYFYYGDGTLVAFDHAGKEIWKRSIAKDYGEFAYQWTYGASPTLHAGKLFIQVLQRDVPVNGRGAAGAPIESYLLALEPATGKTLWRHVRPSEAAAESLEAYSTPIPFKHDGRDELLIAGGDVISGHDPMSGRELWRWGTWNPRRIGHWRLVPSPVAGGGVVLACAPKADPIYAIKAGGVGVLPDAAIAWKSEGKREISSDVPTPAFYQGDFFVLNEGRRTLARVIPKTGEVKWTTELPGRKKFESSPTAADGRIYVMNFAGDVSVINAEDGKVQHTVAMGDAQDDLIRSSIVAADGRLYIRTNNKLFCIGKK